MVVKARHIWCCMDIFDLSKVIGFLGFVFSFLQSLICVMILVNMHLHNTEFRKGELDYTYSKLGAFVIDFNMSLLLMAGAFYRKKILFLPWLIYRAIGISVLLPVGIYWLQFEIEKENPEKIFEASVFLMIVLVALWFWLSIFWIMQFCFEEQLKNTSNVVKPLSKEERNNYVLVYMARVLP